MQVALIDGESARQIITSSLAYAAVSRAFVSAWSGSSSRFPVLAARGLRDGAVVGIKFGNDASLGAIGFKAGTYWPDNESRGLPNHAALTVLLDPETGFPLAFINAGWINRWRTAAADAVAVSALSRPEAASMAVFGAGRQAEFEVRAIIAVRPIRRVCICSRNQRRSAALAASLRASGVDVDLAEPRPAVEGADIIVTVTNANAPLFAADWVKPGTHISAMGTDVAGKQELDPALFSDASLFADDPVQSCVIGEFQHLADERARTRIQPIGAVLAQAVPGRRRHDEVTIFDSSGIAAQDVAVGHAVLQEARARGLCRLIDF